MKFDGGCDLRQNWETFKKGFKTSYKWSPLVFIAFIMIQTLLNLILIQYGADFDQMHRTGKRDKC